LTRIDADVATSASAAHTAEFRVPSPQRWAPTHASWPTACCSATGDRTRDGRRASPSRTPSPSATWTTRLPPWRSAWTCRDVTHSAH